MYSAVRRYETDPKNVSEVKRRIEEEFVPIIRKVSGFVSYEVLDAGNGVLATISFFDSKTGAEESTQRAADWVKTVRSLLPTPPQVTAGEIVVRNTK